MKDDNNKPIYIIVSLLILFIAVITGIDMMTGDDRANMTTLPETNLIFKNTLVELNGQYWDKKDEIAELHLIKSDAFLISDNVIVSIKDQNKQDLSPKIIVGDSDTEDDITITDIDVRFRMPEDTWYIDVEITRDDISYQFIIDYRDFKKVNLR